MMLAMAGTNVVHLFAVAGSATTAVPAGAPVATGFGATGVGRLVPPTLRFRAEDWTLAVRVTGTGALTFQGRLWIMSQGLGTFAVPGTDLNVWSPAGKAATMANRGLLNEGNTLSSEADDLLTHQEPFEFLGPIDGAYLQITTLTGTGAAVHAWLVSADPRA